MPICTLWHLENCILKTFANLYFVTFAISTENSNSNKNSNNNDDNNDSNITNDNTEINDYNDNSDKEYLKKIMKKY